MRSITIHAYGKSASNMMILQLKELLQKLACNWQVVLHPLVVYGRPRPRCTYVAI